MRIMVVSGGFDPIHKGHIELLKDAKSRGDYLIVGVNDNEWLLDKKQKVFMTQDERLHIIEHLDMVDQARIIPFDESRSACSLLEQVKLDYPDYEIVFCNGGDRTSANIPEMEVEGISFEFEVGGSNKANSSSWLLRNALAQDSEERQWGKFYNFFIDKDIKVKELIVEPGKKLSYQRHHLRNELWFVSRGTCTVRECWGDKQLIKHQTHVIRKGSWHQLINTSDEPCHIIEIQYGEETREDDIERDEKA